MASDIWLRTILIVRKETRYRHIGYSYRLTARVLLYAPSHRQDITYSDVVTLVVEHWLEREIAQWVHPMKDRSDDPSHHERTLLPRSYISLQCVTKPSGPMDKEYRGALNIMVVFGVHFGWVLPVHPLATPLHKGQNRRTFGTSPFFGTPGLPQNSKLFPIILSAPTAPIP